MDFSVAEDIDEGSTPKINKQHRAWNGGGWQPSRHINAETLNVWGRYRDWVRKHEADLLAADDVFGLCLTPLSLVTPRRWVETLLGLVQLHRVAFDLALQVDPFDRSYGTSVYMELKESNASSITTCRLLLTAFQGLWPIIHEFLHVDRHPEITAVRRASARRWVERVRFAMRIYILVNYWRGGALISKRSLTDNIRTKRADWLPGLLMCGGLFPTPPGTMAVSDERARLHHFNYEGRRTGRRIVHQDIFATHSDIIKVVVGEILFILRPLFQAEADRGSGEMSSLWKQWLLALAADAISLWFLRRPCQIGGSEATQMEWQRRRGRLFYYVLRAPFWDLHTRPMLERVGWVPGAQLLASYIHFWKLYQSEE